MTDHATESLVHVPRGESQVCWSDLLSYSAPTDHGRFLARSPVSSELLVASKYDARPARRVVSLRTLLRVIELIPQVRNLTLQRVRKSCWVEVAIPA